MNGKKRLSTATGWTSVSNNPQGEPGYIYQVKSKYPSTGCYSEPSDEFVVNTKSLNAPVLAFEGLSGSISKDYLCGSGSGDISTIEVSNYDNDYNTSTIFRLINQSSTTVQTINNTTGSTPPQFDISTSGVYKVRAEDGQCVSALRL